MDFSEQLAAQKLEEDTSNSEGVSLLRNMQESEALKEEKRQNGKFQSAFDSSDLNNSGLPMSDYDYEKEFNEGNSFKTDDMGGVNLSNSNIKETAVNVGGFDLGTGKKYVNKWNDNDGRIRDGVLELQKSNINSTTGTPNEDMMPLSSIGMGIMSEGGTYEDFIESTQGLPWTDKQRAISWESAKQAKQTTEDVKDYGSRIFKESSAEPIEDIDIPIVEDIDESELKTSAGWIQSSTNVLEALTPGSTTGMTPEEISNASLELMSDFNWNIPTMMSITSQVVNSRDPELAKSFLYLMKQNDATNISWGNTGRALTSVATDITIWATLGGSVLVSRVAGAAMRMGVKRLLTKAATVTAFDASVGGTVGAMTDISTQAIEGKAGERDELDTSQVAKTAAVSAGVTTVLGLGASAVSDPVLRKFGIDAMRRGANNLRGGKARPSGGPTAQRGAIDISRTPTQVEFKSRLDEHMDNAFGKKSTVKIQHLQNTIKNWVKKGIVKQEEVDWAGINMLDPSESVNREEIRAFVNHNRPVPQLNPVAETRHSMMSLGNPGGGYREVIISVDKTGFYEGPAGHFGKELSFRQRFGKNAGRATVPSDQANVGHLRLATSRSNGKRGTMLLEGQSDIRKERKVIPNTTVARSIRKNKLVNSYSDAVKRYKLAELESNQYLVSMMEKYGIDPTAEVGRLSVIRHMTSDEYDVTMKFMHKEGAALSAVDEADKRIADQVKIQQESRTAMKGETELPPFTPFRDKKKSNELLFRSSVMEAMNDGSEFLSWPSNDSQISAIQNWPEGLFKVQSIFDMYQKDLPKIAKAYGFKVEKYVPDEFDTPDYKTGPINLKHSEYNIDQNFNSKAEMVQWMIEEMDIDLSEESIDDFLYDGSQWLTTSLGKHDPSTYEFNRIVFSPEDKKKWREEGAAMYSFGAAVGLGVAVKEQERDERGRFK